MCCWAVVNLCREKRGVVLLQLFLLFCGRLLRNCLLFSFVLVFFFGGSLFTVSLSWVFCQWPESYLDWATKPQLHITHICHINLSSRSDFPVANPEWPWTDSWSKWWRDTGTEQWLSGKLSTSGVSCPFSTQVCILIWFGLSSLPNTKAPVFFLAIDQDVFCAFLQTVTSPCIHLQWYSGHAPCGATPRCVVSVLCKCVDFYLLLGVVEVFGTVWAQVPTPSLPLSFYSLAVELGQGMFDNSPCHRVLWQQGNLAKGNSGHCTWWLSKPRFFSIRGMP